MDISKLKGFVVNNKIPCILGACGVVIATTVAGVYFAVKPSNDVLKLRQEEFEIQLGEQISSDPAYYLDTSHLEKSEAERVLTKAKVTPPKKVKKVGSYIAEIKYDISKISAKLNVVDTIAPSFENIDNLTVPAGTIYSDKEFREMFIVFDGDENIDLTIDTGGYDGNKEGTYTIKGIAKDSSGNKSEYSFTITVSTLVKEVEYSENTTTVVTKVNNEKKNNSNTSNSNFSSSKPSSNNFGNSSVSQNKPSGNSTVYVKNVTISGNKNINQYNTVELVATINPTNATLGDRAYKWTSSNESIARITGGQGFSSATIYGEKEGSATITCTVGGVSASYTVTVKKQEQQISKTDDFDAIKLIFINTSGQRYVKTFSQMTSGTSFTFNLADYGITCENGGIIAGAGFALDVDSSKWYQQTSYPMNEHNTHDGGTFKFRNDNGTIVTITCIVDRVNTTFDNYRCIIYGAC